MNISNLTLQYHRHNRWESTPEILKHTLLFNELTCVLQGEITYTVNGEEVALSAGSILFVPRGYERQRFAGQSADYVSFNFLADEERFPFELHAKQAFDNEIFLLLKCYDECVSSQSVNAHERITHILHLILLKLYDYYNAPKYSQLTQDMISYLKEHVRKQLTLHDLEKQFFFSPFYLAKKFKKETGVSIIQYFNQLKIAEAKNLIAEQALSLEEIAEYLGFSDYNYFSRLFKKLCAVSPSQLKRSYVDTPIK